VGRTGDLRFIIEAPREVVKGSAPGTGKWLVMPDKPYESVTCANDSQKGLTNNPRRPILSTL